MEELKGGSGENRTLQQTAGDHRTTVASDVRPQTLADHSSSGTTIQDGGTHERVENSTNSSTYLTSLLSQFQTGQLLARNSHVGDSNTRQSVLGDMGIGLNVQNTTPSNMGPMHNQSRRDPQIYLAAAANGKSVPVFHDITDFVSGNVAEVILVGGNGPGNPNSKMSP